MKEKYTPEITDPSLKELEELASWYNEKMGTYPVIVGGWAAYIYTRGLGSKDIDVVFPDDRSKHATLSMYFAAHGYAERRKSLFDVELIKIVKSKGREVEIIVDAVSAKRFIIIEGTKVRIPWAWAIKHNVTKRIGKAVVYVPTLELLLAYKLGAIFGRNEQLKLVADAAQLQYFRSKIWKDVFDVISLSKLEIDSGALDKFLEESGLAKYRTEIMQLIEDNHDEQLRSATEGVPLSIIRKLVTRSGDAPVTSRTKGVHNPRF